MKVGIVNYGMGNLASVRRALEDLGAEAFIAEHPAALYDASRVVLPGVGAFLQGMQRLRTGGWVEALHDLVHEHRRPLLGICLGMQMLATTGEEGGMHDGLDLVPGRVRRLDDLGCALRIPHVGWNDTASRRDDPLFAHIPQASDFYFVHSFAFDPEDEADVIARTDYDVPLVAAVRRGSVFGTQFHPEKSSRVGRQLLRNFLDFRPC
ncbi:imidazole glycerol phosphate synthase subunit HisH [Paucibacter sp. B51]|uniref:imidazole glycerol phosphate synthase subunit HisH n=1 Tax=Paucibacter sp. B51 TaxID=2993315 RepID=UPI0022EC0508|nr:imidazole glycerol phosphate synthase subunit HisH [Paucibacter sp. B51]